MTKKLSDPSITMPRFNEGGVFKPLLFLYIMSNPLKNGTKGFSFENRFHWWGHKSKLSEKQAINGGQDIAGFPVCHWMLLFQNSKFAKALKKSKNEKHALFVNSLWRKRLFIKIQNFRFYSRLRILLTKVKNFWHVDFKVFPYFSALYFAFALILK